LVKLASSRIKRNSVIAKLALESSSVGASPTSKPTFELVPELALDPPPQETRRLRRTAGTRCVFMASKRIGI
jgi:hypothetical protein